MRRERDKMVRGSRKLNRTIPPVCHAHPEYDPGVYGKPLYVCVYCENAWDAWKKQKGVVEK